MTGKVRTSYFQCAVCDESFNSEKFLTAHNQKKHSKIPKTKLECHLCDYSTVNNGNLKRHIEKKHKTGTSGRDVEPVVEGQNNSFDEKLKCHLCDFSTFYSVGLNRHIGKKHKTESPGDDQESDDVVQNDSSVIVVGHSELSVEDTDDTVELVSTDESIIELDVPHSSPKLNKLILDWSD